MNEIPTIGPLDGPGWRLRPKGWRYRGLDDHDPRGQGDAEAAGPEISAESYPQLFSGGSPPDLPPAGGGTGGDHPREPGGERFGRLRLLPSRSAPPYVELHCHTCYSFREGASTPRELVGRAAALGYGALAVTDRDGLYGAMEFAKAAEAVGIRPIIGADVTLQGG